MAGDAIKIVIEAEDKASAQAINAAKNIESAVKGVKETGQKAKASTEFIGVLAGQLGGSQLQQAAGGVAAITEKVGQFSEVMKAGGAGAMAFQAGITLLVTTLSFNLGKAIGESIFGVQELKDEFGEARAQIEGFTQSMINASDKGFKEKLEDISLIKDPAKQQNEAVAAFEEIQKSINKAYDSFHYRQREIERLRGETDILGNNDEAIAMLELENEQYNATIASLEKQKWALSDVYGERANNLKAIKAQQKAEDDAAAKAKQTQASIQSQLKKNHFAYLELTKGVEAARMAQLADEGIDETNAKRIVFAEQATRLEKERAEAKKKADDDEAARIQRLASLEDSELAKLKEQKILLEEGQEAANRFKLEQQGLSKEAAARIANEQAAIDLAKTLAEDAKKQQEDARLAAEQADKASLDRQKKQGELAKKLAEKPQLMSVEQRLVSRGVNEDTQKDIAANTLKTVERLDAVAEAIKNQAKPQGADALQLEFVG
jgi:hypothetical protein